MPKEKGARKYSKKKARFIIQRIARCWLARHFYLKFKEEVKMMEQDAFQVLSEYKSHLMEIMTQHAVDLPSVETNFREVYDYMVKKRCYEEEFDAFAAGEENISFENIEHYFHGLNLQPTKGEICLAAETILLGDNFKAHQFSKLEIVDVALHIYPPCGTHLKNTRKSTWLYPIVNNDNALRLLDDKVKKKTKLAKPIHLVSPCMDKKPGRESGSSKEEEN